MSKKRFKVSVNLYINFWVFSLIFSFLIILVHQRGRLTTSQKPGSLKKGKLLGAEIQADFFIFFWNFGHVLSLVVPPNVLAEKLLLLLNRQIFKVVWQTWFLHSSKIIWFFLMTAERNKIKGFPHMPF